MRRLRCDRFEREALLLLERGEPLLDDHYDQCSECRASREEYERLKVELPNARHPVSLPLDLNSRVYERIDGAGKGSR